VRRATKRRELVGFDLIFSGRQKSEWPGLADDVMWLFDRDKFPVECSGEMKGLDHLAYRYLILVRKEWQGLGIARFMGQLSEELLRRERVPVLVGEVYLLPVPNVASLRWHESQEFLPLGSTAQFTGQTLPRERALTFYQMAKALQVGDRLVYELKPWRDYQHCWRLVTGA